MHKCAVKSQLRVMDSTLKLMDFVQFAGSTQVNLAIYPQTNLKTDADGNAIGKVCTKHDGFHTKDERFETENGVFENENGGFENGNDGFQGRTIAGHRLMSKFCGFPEESYSKAPTCRPQSIAGGVSERLLVVAGWWRGALRMDGGANEADNAPDSKDKGTDEQ